MWMVSRLAIIADTSATGERGRQIAALGGMHRVGELMGPAVGGFVAAVWGIRIPFVIHGFLAILAIIPSFTLIRETAPSRSRVASSPQEVTAAPVELSCRRLEFLSLPFHPGPVNGAGADQRRAGSGGYGIRWWWSVIPLYGVRSRCGSGHSGVLSTINAAITFPSSSSSGTMMDRYGRKSAVVPGASLLVVVMLFLAATAYWDMSFKWFLVGFFLANIAASLTGGSMQTLGADLAPRTRGESFSGTTGTGLWEGGL